MLKNSVAFHTVCRSSRGGFTLVELLVVIAIIGILAGLAVGPIIGTLETGKEAAAVLTAHSISVAELQYSIDNGSYPGGSRSQDVAISLVQGGYTTDPSIFAASKDKAYTGTAAGISAMPASAICWDFFAVQGGAGNTTNTGLSTSDPDGIPALFTTGQEVTIPSTGPGPAITINANQKNPFGSHGMAVCFKNSSSQFLKAENIGGVSQVNTKSANYLFNASFNVSSPGVYIQLKPQ